MRFRYIDRDGIERVLEDATALAEAVRTGAVLPDTPLWDRHSDRWIPATSHDVFRALEVGGALSSGDAKDSQPLTGSRASENPNSLPTRPGARPESTEQSAGQQAGYPLFTRAGHAAVYTAATLIAFLAATSTGDAFGVRVGEALGLALGGILFAAVAMVWTKQSRRFIPLAGLVVTVVAATGIDSGGPTTSSGHSAGTGDGIETFAESRFTRLSLARGVSVELPENWWLIGPEFNMVIETGAEAISDFVGESVDWSESSNLIAANSSPRTTYAALRINLYDPPLATPRETQSLRTSDLRMINEELVDRLRLGLAKNGIEILENQGTEKVTLASYPGFRTTYRRSGIKGPVLVQIYQVFLPEFTLRMNLSYRESERVLWIAVIERIAASLQVANHSGDVPGLTDVVNANNGPGWVSHSIGPLELELPSALTRLDVPMTEADRSQIRTVVDSFETYQGEAGDVEIVVNQVRYKSHINVNLHGAANGAIARTAQEAGDREPEVTHRKGNVSGYPAVRSSAWISGEAGEFRVEALTVGAGDRMWQVSTFFQPVARNFPVAERVLRSLAIAN